PQHPHGAAEGSLSSRFRFLHQHRKRQGPGTRRQSAHRAVLPLEDAKKTNPRARSCRARQRCGGRRLFRHAPEGQPDRRLGQRAIAPDGRPFCLRARDREIRREIRARQSPAPAALGRLSRDAASDRVLARPSFPSARPARLHPRRCQRAMDDRTLIPMSDHGTLMHRAALASLSVTVFLIALKFVAYIATDSVSMLASLADSGLDFFASMINLVAVRSSLTPPDREHRFGHGKAEPLAGLAQGAFIAGSATFLIIEAVSRLTQPHVIEREIVGFVVMGIAIAATIGLVGYQRMVVAKTASLAISSDQSHYTSDLITNVGVVVSLVLSAQFGWKYADPLIAIAIALFL